MLAVFRQPDEETDVSVISRSLCLALDDVQDPGNLGTIVRLADWFGIEHIFCSPNTVDIYNPKTVQATMGGIARVRLHYTPLPEFIRSLKDIPVYGTFLDGENMYGQPLSKNGLIVMGNEGNGIGKEVEALINRYNEMLLERKRLLRTSSESNPVVVNLDASIRAMRSNVQTTILSVQKGLMITKADLERQAGKYAGRITSAPGQERQLVSISRQQEIKAWRQEQGHPGNAYEQNVYKDNAYSTRVRQRRVRAERQRRRRQARIRRYIKISLLCASILAGIFMLKNLLEVPASTAEASTPVEVAAEAVQRIEKQIGETTGTRIQGLPADVYAAHPNWTEDFLTVNEYSRPGDPLTEVKNIFVHYTANPGTSAAQNRSYFEQLKDNHERSASAHFIIGYDGEILQCVPLDEIAYAVQTRNEDSISIECCYKADNGQFTQETYDSLIKLLKWLTDAYDLQPDDILRHYDCGGKKCPIYYTEHEDAWNKLKEDVKNL